MRRLLGSVGVVVLVVGVAANQAHAQPGTFSLPTLNVTDCFVPAVNISTTEAGGTLGFDFEIGFDENVLVVESVDTVAPATDDCQFAVNDSNPGVVSISIACTQEVVGDDPIATITFRAIGTGTSDLNFSECWLDEVACPTPVDGAVTVGGCPAVNLSAGGQGSFGLSPGRACATATLASNGAGVATVVTDLNFDPTKFGVGTCLMNSSLTSLDKSIDNDNIGPGHQRITISDNDGLGTNHAIPSGQIFACALTIAAGQATGPYVIDNTSATSNASSVPFPTTGVDGIINVTACGGDCDGSGLVSILEISRASNLFLGQPLCNGANSALSCPNANMIDNDGSVSIQEVQRMSCLFTTQRCSKTCP